MAENRKGRGQGLYYWTRGQLVVLAVVFAATSVVIFFLGILVGQGIEERKLLKKEEPLIKIPAQPLSPGGGVATPGKEEMTFYEELAKKAPSAPPATRIEPAKETKPAEKAAPAVREAKAPAREVKVATADKTKTAEKIKEKSAAGKPAPAAEAAREAPARKASEPKQAAAGSEAQEKIWAVQVNAFPFERDAKGLAKRLSDKGYDAYVVPTNIKGKDWYRVRVGRFKTQEEAKTLQETLKTKEKFTKSITTSR